MLIRRSSKPRLELRSEQGFTLTELLVAMVIGLIVTGALFAILSFSAKQETRISDRVQADRIGRTAMANILDELHSSCAGFGSTAIQAPSSTPTSPLAASGGLNLWFLSAYGNPSSGAALSGISEHDINWTATGTSDTGLSLGTLTDYSFAGTGESPNWVFPTLAPASATSSKVLAKNVVPLEASTVFQYYRYETTTTSANYGKLVRLGSSELPPTILTAKKIAQVNVAFSQAPEKGDTRAGHTSTFSGAVVLRFSPTEAGTEGSTCT